MVVQVRGRDTRLTPIRACWTDTARQALTLAHQRTEECARFIVPQDRNAAARAANRIRIGDTALSLRRARATWLTAHLEAGTPLRVLRVIAGPLSAAMLDDVLAAGSAVSAEQAVTKALRASTGNHNRGSLLSQTRQRGRVTDASSLQAASPQKRGSRSQAGYGQ